MKRIMLHDGLTSIVAIGQRGEIGCNNSLPWRLKSDLRFFKQTTIDNVVIMGRKTYDSIGCLKGRENIVLSHRASLFEVHKGCAHAHSIGESLYLRNKFQKKDAYVIGGSITYSQFAPYIDRYLITFVKAQFVHADTFLDQTIFSDPDDWQINELEVERLEGVGSDDHEFSVVELIHKHPLRIGEARKQVIEEYKSRNHLLQRKASRRRVEKTETLDLSLLLA